MLIKQKVLFSQEECELIIKLSKINHQEWKSKDRSYNSLVLNYNENTVWLFDKLIQIFKSSA